jgi:hypothetical protein
MKGGNPIMVATDKKEYINCVMDWEQIVDLFPDMWVVVTDYEKEEGLLRRCKLIAVFTDDEVENGSLHGFIHKGNICKRTTIGLQEGYIHGRIIEVKNPE